MSHFPLEGCGGCLAAEALTITEEQKMTIEYLNSLVNDERAPSIPVTVSVKGTIVSGRLISREEYIACYVEMIRNLDSSKAENLATLIKQEMRSTMDLEGKAFFKDVLLLPGNIKILVWCVPISEIDGIAWGNVLSNSEKE